MADTVAPTCTELRAGEAAKIYNTGSVYTRTFSFPVLATATGYGDTDIWNLITIPKNTKIIDMAIKSSVIQTATPTFNLTGKTAFAAATPACAAADTWYCPTVAVADVGANGYGTANADTVLQGVNSTATCNAGTYTVTLTCVALGGAESTYTTQNT